MANNPHRFSRRDFFRFRKTSTRKEMLKQLSQELVGTQYKRIFLRPPGAVSENKFITQCDGCSLCIEACPHDAIFLYADSSQQTLYNNTAAIDPYQKPCRACEDWPCIKACPTGALQDQPELKVIGKAKINLQHCLIIQGQHCDYCFRSCPTHIKALSKNEKGLPVIDEDLCVGCGKCAYICVSQTGRAIEVIPNENNEAAH